MADIKSVVGLLSKVLNNYFKSNLKAEHFRLAKYDKTEEDVVVEFWNLLYLCSKKYDNKNIVQGVKYYFASLLYQSAEFYALPNDMSYGSRELLLAFSWLLCKHNTIETHLKEEISNSEISKEFNLNFFQSDTHDSLPSSLKTIEDYFNYITYLLGRINDNIKKINEYKTKTLQLTTKIHKDTFNSKKFSHLSTTETYLLKNHAELKIYMSKIEGVANMLEYYFRWKSREKYYWEWLVTVLKLKEKNSKKDVDVEVISKFHSDLRIHVKNKLLTKKESEELKNVEINFPRCIFAPDHEIYKTENPQIADTKYLKQLKTDNDNSTKSILNFIKSFKLDI